MNSHQNYTTIDSYKPDKTTVLRVSEIHETLSEPWNPKSKLTKVDDAKPHFVVAKYHSKDWSRTTTDAIELRSSELQFCEHFEGPTAEGDAMTYYLSLVDPDEFPAKAGGLCVENFPSYQAERKFPKPEQ